MKEMNAEYWAPRINAEWRKSVEGILNVGRQLIAAKQACEHGEFLRLFKGHDNAVSEPVPFTESTGRMLMAVASNEVISNREFVHDLPQSWGTLYELTKLDDEQIVAGIKAGEITPGMTRAEAVALRADPIERPKLDPHEQMADAIEAATCKFIGRLTTPAEFEYVLRRVNELAEFIASEQAERAGASQSPCHTTTTAGEVPAATL